MDVGIRSLSDLTVSSGRDRVFPGSLFLHQRFNNKAKVRDIDAPILVIHSRGDHLYPYAQGELLFQKASEPKEFLEVFGDHGEGAIVSKEIFVAGVEAFLERISTKGDVVRNSAPKKNRV